MIPFGCGQCIPCRINRKRLWTHRLMLESFSHSDATFVTLTYDPEKYSGESLRPEDVTKFLKRLRRKLEPKKLRYYLVGEYGDKTGRPHYHIALFGFPNCIYMRSNYTRRKRICCPNCDLVADT